MVQITSSGSSVSFQFTNSPFYLYGNGTMNFPLNSLLMLIDSSDMVSFKNEAGDVVVSTTLAELGKTKAEMEELYQSAFVGSQGGGGVTSGEVANMISAATSGLAESSAVTEVSNALTSHTSDTTIHVTSTDKQTWNAKQNALSGGNNIQISNNGVNLVFSAGTEATGNDYKPSPDIAFNKACLIKTSNMMANTMWTDDFKHNIYPQSIGNAKTLSLPWSLLNNGDSDTLATKTRDLDGLKLKKISQSDYDQLTTKDANTLYVIVN